MPFLTDTDLVIDHLANIPQANQLLDKLASEGIAISIITYMEVYQGVVRRLNPKEAQAKFQTFRRSVPVLPISLSVAKRCATLREHLKQEQKRVKLRALDLINAAIALEHNLTLVTRNVEDYDDIPYLELYQGKEPRQHRALAIPCCMSGDDTPRISNAGDHCRSIY